MKLGVSMMLAYHHDYNCLSPRELWLWSLDTQAQQRVKRFEMVKQTSITRFYK